MLSTHQISKLEEAFLHDASPEEAAALAKVTFYDLTQYIALNGDWYTKCLQSAHLPIVQAKVNLGQSVLDGDLDNSKYLLERKRPREWSPKAQLDITSTKPLIVYDLAAAANLQPGEVVQLAPEATRSLGSPTQVQISPDRGVEGSREELLREEVPSSPAV